MIKIFLLINILLILGSCSIFSQDSKKDLFSKKKDCYDSMLEYRNNILPDYNYEWDEKYSSTTQIEQWFYSKKENSCYIEIFRYEIESWKYINTHSLIDLYTNTYEYSFNSRHISDEEYSQKWEEFNKSVRELKNGDFNN